MYTVYMTYIMMCVCVYSMCTHTHTRAGLEELSCQIKVITKEQLDLGH